MQDKSPPQSEPHHEDVIQHMEMELARLIGEHMTSHVMSTFVARTGVARNRVFRIRDKLQDDDSDAEIRFTVGELSRIARELRFESLTAMIEYVEHKALLDLDEHSHETVHRRQALELATKFMRLSEREVQVIQEAIDMVPKMVPKPSPH